MLKAAFGKDRRISFAEQAQNRQKDKPGPGAHDIENTDKKLFKSPSASTFRRRM